MMSKRLARQINKTLGSENWEDDLGANVLSFVERLKNLFAVIDETYQQQDAKILLAERNLQFSSQELTDANQDLFQMNRIFDAMVNSLSQGFFLFGPDGICLPIYSRACEVMLETKVANKSVADVLQIPESERDAFKNWYQFLFEEKIAFQDIANLGPARFPNSNGRLVTLEYVPSRNENGRIANIVVVATDRTEEFEAKQQAEEMQAYAKMIISILKHKDRFRRFIIESRRMLTELEAIGNKPDFDHDDLTLAQRILHTLKGASSSFYVEPLKRMCHSIETRLQTQMDLAQMKTECLQSADLLSREIHDLLEKNHEIIGDLVVAEKKREIATKALWEFAQTLCRETPPDQLLAFYTKNILAVPLRDICAEYNPILFGIATRLKKSVEPIIYVGDEISVVRENYKGFWDCLIHVFRNIVDHGIEFKEQRLLLGKPHAGRITFEVHQTQSTLQIRIHDDGAGIDPERIRRKLRTSARPDLAAEADPEVLINHIFNSGFSTAQEITDLSGRGVGLDVVRSEVVELGGHIHVRSKLNEGTTFVIDLPNLNQISVMKQSA